MKITILKDTRSRGIDIFGLFGCGFSYEFTDEERSVSTYIKLWKFCTYLTFSLL